MKKTKNIITFYPFSAETESFAPKPVPAIKLVPEWYRRQPGNVDDKNQIPRGFATSTVKRCMPIFDVMTAGYILMTPCDIYVDATNPDKLEYSVPNQLGGIRRDLFSSHSPEQYDQYPIDKEKYHKELLRILPFWACSTSSGYSSLITQPAHIDQTPLTAFPGIIDTDTFVTDGHFSFLVEKGFKGVIKQGTPIIQIIPFKREDWEMEISPVEKSEKIFSAQRLRLRSMFFNGYKAKYRFKKEYK